MAATTSETLYHLKLFHTRSTISRTISYKLKKLPLQGELSK